MRRLNQALVFYAPVLLLILLVTPSGSAFSNFINVSVFPFVNI